MEEEIQIINENTKKEKIKNFFIKNVKYFIFSISSLIILVLAYFVYIEIQSRNQIKLAEKYNNTVNNFQNLKNTEQTKKILVDIIEKKNSTYSPLALYFIIDNDLESKKNEINKYFDKVISISSLEKEIKNLNIYKKAVFNSDFVSEIELVEILRPITNSDSIWKSHSLLLLSEYFYFKKNYAESKKLLNEILSFEDSNPEIKLEAKKKLTRDFSE
mgnify:FL=1|tara:strand:+ start:547 stop:1194 length:648 start_codon:yes stop_codon:yes gene_type:complete